MRRMALAALLALAAAGCWQRDVGRSYYPSGKVKSEATVKNNVLDGPAVTYYESGRKMSEANYRAGVLDGKSTAWYESGARKAEAEYRDGVLDGTSTSWSESGAVIGTARFDHGRLVAPRAPAAETASATREKGK